MPKTSGFKQTSFCHGHKWDKFLEICDQKVYVFEDVMRDSMLGSSKNWPFYWNNHKGPKPTEATFEKPWNLIKIFYQPGECLMKKKGC